MRRSAWVNSGAARSGAAGTGAVGLTHPLFAATLLAAVLAGCAGARLPPGPVVSPTGIVYETGTPPRGTQFSQSASLFLTQDEPERALPLALEGIEAEPQNPIHYYLAGLAFVALGDLREADRVWREAERLYPAYELDIEPARERVWAEAFNLGVEAYLEGDLDAATELWRAGARLYDLRPDIHRNLAVLLADRGQPDEAIEIYRMGLAGLERAPASRLLDEGEAEAREEARAAMETNLAQLLLFHDRFSEAEAILRRRLAADPGNADLQAGLAEALIGLGRDEEAAALYGEILDAPGLAEDELFALGVALFRARDFDGAARALERLTELQPQGRDAWFNLANALLAAEDWERLAPVGERLVELDPLGEMGWLITARAHAELGNEPEVREALRVVEDAPAYLADLQMVRSLSSTTVRGRVVGAGAEEGTELRLRFTFQSAGGVAGTETLSVRVPEPGEGTPFSLSFDGAASSYRYERLP